MSARLAFTYHITMLDRSGVVEKTTEPATIHFIGYKGEVKDLDNKMHALIIENLRNIVNGDTNG